jgi:hypothetical protein
MIAGLVGVTVVPLAGVLCLSTAASAAKSRTVTVTPNHGVSGAPFTVVYREPAVGLLFSTCSADSVTVTFDGAGIGGAPLRVEGGDCVATLSGARPPSTAGPGPHTVRVAGTPAATTYTVDPPSPTAKAPAPGSPSATKASPSGTPATPSAGPTAPASDPPRSGAVADSPSARPIVTMPGPNASGGASATPWVLAGGGLLILGDLVLLVLLTGRTRRATRRGQPSTG